MGVIVVEIIVFLISGTMLVLGGWQLYISLDYRKGKTAQTTARLTKTEYTKRLNHHDRHGRYIYCHTRFIYTYTVEGKLYTIEEGRSNTKPKGSSARVERATVIYQRKRPAHAYLKNGFPGELLGGAILSGAGLLWLVIGMGLVL